ncbi:MAG: hypothetical protein NPIRA04_32290 [Nitrospirales bacterium]|nr:MAG: hypothetical protein NPIRA04_32290 [Nitrospirales bacterium]
MSFLSCLTLLHACSTPQTTNIVEQVLATVEIDEAAHFPTPSGEDITVMPGAYQIKTEQYGIRLFAEEGTESESMLIEAKPTNHTESIIQPIALMSSDKKGHRVVTLLRPNGERWDAWGTQGAESSLTGQPLHIPSAQIMQRFNTINLDKAIIPQFSLASVSVKYDDTKKSHKGEKLKTTWRLPVNDTLDSGSFTFTWRGYWEKSAFQPSFIPSKVVDLQNLVKKKQCCITLTVDGKEAPLTRLSFSKHGTLLTRVQLDNVRVKTWPKTVKVVVTKGKKTWESASIKIYAKAISYYESVLHPIFSHDRCTTCHALGTHDKIVDMHQYRIGIEKFPYEFDEEARPQNPTFCETCHKAPYLKNAWFSPLSVQEIDWKGLDAIRVCRKVTGPFINKDGEVEPPFDRKRLTQHFHENPRIIWAISDGLTPSGKDLNVPLSKKLSLWFRKVDPWVEAGTPCPTNTKFFQRQRHTLTEKFFPRQ